jgi:hypothetical protein
MRTTIRYSPAGWLVSIKIPSPAKSLRSVFPQQIGAIAIHAEVLWTEARYGAVRNTF